jgi:hypothetical protein
MEKIKKERDEAEVIFKKTDQEIKNLKKKYLEQKRKFK